MTVEKSNSYITPEQSILNSNLSQITPIEAEQLGVDYFKQQAGVFEVRYMSLREKVPVNIRQAWDKQAEGFGAVMANYKSGDTRLIKEWTIRRGMEWNVLAHNNPVNGKEQSALGKALYAVGTLITARTIK